MLKNITVSDIKKNNLSLIYNLIYNSGKISKQEIATRLNLSLPTVSQKLVQLEKQGLISKNGHFESSVGRRAAAYMICPDARISIGVAVYRKKITILSVDLAGNVCDSVNHDKPFENSETYYKDVAYLIKDFILEKNYLIDHLLGIGFAMSGLTSVDGKKIIFGKTFGYTGLDISVFSQYLNYPCSFFHDAKCAANTEIWFNEEISDALYLSMERYLGGVTIINGQILMGENGHCGSVEHMQMVPDGKECYCGKKGCIESYCSISALLRNDERTEDFFKALRDGSSEHMSRWDSYLKTLSVALNNFHLILDRNIILGGKLSYYLIDEDMNKLKELMSTASVFPDKGSFIQLSKYPKDAVSVGASLYYIQEFLQQI
jgi:predicted NBD/HSP70 family sugar kinase